MKRKKPVIAITIEIILAIAIMSGLLLSVFMVLDERKGELNPAKAQGEVLGDDTISGDESTEVIQEFLETDFASMKQGILSQIFVIALTTFSSPLFKR